MKIKPFELVLRAVITAFFGSLMAFKLCTFAYEDRGYAAIGGEWIVIIGFAFALWKLTGYISKLAKEGTDESE